MYVMSHLLLLVRVTTPVPENEHLNTRIYTSADIIIIIGALKLAFECLNYVVFEWVPFQICSSGTCLQEIPLEPGTSNMFRP